MGKTETDTTIESQAEKFRRAAREHETDDSEEAFNLKLKKIATAPKPKATKPSKPSKDQ